MPRTITDSLGKTRPIQASAVHACTGAASKIGRDITPPKCLTTSLTLLQNTVFTIQFLFFYVFCMYSE
jgi:hypothetical protein